MSEEWRKGNRVPGLQVHRFAGILVPGLHFPVFGFLLEVRLTANASCCLIPAPFIAINGYLISFSLVDSCFLFLDKNIWVRARRTPTANRLPNPQLLLQKGMGIGFG